MRINVGYFRLSNKDKSANDDYSESINNQKRIVDEYAKENGIKIDKYYIDDGYSGSNYERPAIQELLNDIENNRIDTIITKDMSRLGRNFIETAYYIEKYFDKYNVRYISVNDFYDSNDKESALKDLIVGIKSIINDSYIKEVSKKIKQSKSKITQEGYYIGNIDPYGYRIVKEGTRSKLEIDEKVAPIIRYIFEEKAKNINPNVIADELNRRGIDTPYYYIKKKIGSNDFENKWDYRKIYRIVRNVIYKGCMFYRRTYKDDVHKKKISVIPLKDRIIVENTHVGIVNDELFNKANNNITRNTSHEKALYNGNYKEIVFCGNCGRLMKIHSRYRKQQDFVLRCTTSCNNKRCNTSTILVSKLNRIVKSLLYELIENDEMKNDIIDLKKEKDGNNNCYEEKLNHLLNRNQRVDEDIKELYLKRSMNTISEEEYKREISELKNKKNNNNIEIDKLKCKIDENNQEIKLLEEYNSMLSDEKFIEDNITLFVDRIIFYNDRTVKINFKFHENKDEVIKLY